MYSLTITNDRGDETILTGNPNYTIYRIDGLTPPKVTVNDSVNTTSDGSKINSVRLEKRNIVIYLKIEGEAEKNRIDLYSIFPIKRWVTLHFANGSRDVSIRGVVESNEPGIFDQAQTAQISIICEDPYFSEIDDLITVFGDVIPMFQFPFAISEEGVVFSVLEKNTRQTIFNSGEVETGIIIELFAYGEVVNPVIYDTFAKTQMALNFTMQQGDKIVIDTNTRKKSITLIRRGKQTNLLGYMRPDSVFLKLQPGDNVFTYDCDSGASNLQLTFISSILYTGV